MNKKISDLISATATLSSDFMILVQSGINKKITLSNLFSTPLPVMLNAAKGLNYGSTPEVLDTVLTKTISVVIPVTHLILSNTSLVLPSGSEGQVKFVYAKQGTGIVTLSANGKSITFSAIGDSAQFLFTAGVWSFMGGTAKVI